jgi:hypothetical protein
MGLPPGRWRVAPEPGRRPYHPVGDAVMYLEQPTTRPGRSLVRSEPSSHQAASRGRPEAQRFPRGPQTQTIKAPLWRDARVLALRRFEQSSAACGGCMASPGSEEKGGVSAPAASEPSGALDRGMWIALRCDWRRLRRRPAGGSRCPRRVPARGAARARSEQRRADGRPAGRSARANARGLGRWRARRGSRDRRERAASD